MKWQTDFQSQPIFQIALIVLAFLVIILVGVSSVIYPSPFAPLMMLGLVATVVTLIILLQKPTWALYVAIFVIFLPLGLIPAQIQSNLNRSLTILTLIAWVIALIVKKRSVTLTFPAILMFGFVVWAAVTLIWANNINSGLIVLQTYTLRFVLYMILIPNVIRSNTELHGLLRTLAISGWIYLVIVGYEIILEGYTPGTQFKALDVNENALGIILLVSLQGILWLAMQPTKKNQVLKRFLPTLFIASALIVTAMSGSRGSAISYLVTLLALMLWKPTRPWAKLSFTFLVLANIFAPFLFQTTLDRIMLRSEDTILGGREAIWQYAWQMIKDQPWFGVGVGNAGFELISYIISLRLPQRIQSVSLHNPVLTVWAETGLPGIILYLGTLVSAGWVFIRQFFRLGKETRNKVLPYYAIVSSIFIGFMNSWFKGGGMETSPTYFMLLALLIIPTQVDFQDNPV